MVTSGDPRMEGLLRQAGMTVKRSWQHMAVSVALCAAVVVWYAVRCAPASVFFGVTGIGAFLVVYNVVRIARARAAVREPSRLERFAQGQRRSHWIRGRLYLVGAPILVAATWVGTLTTSRLPVDSLLALVIATVVMALGWVWWFRVVRRLTYTAVQK